MNNGIKFRPGQPDTYRATRTFSLGSSGIQVHSGSEVKFDGTTVEVAGTTLSLPQLRGAVTQGWVVPVETYDEGDPSYGVPVAAGIQVRHATQAGNPLQPPKKMGLETIEEDEKVVGNTREAAANTRARNAGRKPAQAGNRSRTMVGGVEIEEQDGVPVRNLKTRAKTSTTLTSESAGAHLSAASKVQIDPGQGITEEEMLERMTEPERAEYLATKESLRSQYIEESPSQRKQVATIRKAKGPQQLEGMTVTTSTSAGSTPVEDLSGMSHGKPTVAVVEQEGIRFTTTNGPKAAAQSRPAAQPTAPASPAMVQARIGIAKAMCKDFPDGYDFGAPARKRLARLMADFEDRPDVIRAAWAAETDDVKAIILEEFPAAFG